ncbi:MAG: TIGR01244 family sulfur transferase [Burkholderiaceae bacterium]
MKISRLSDGVSVSPQLLVEDIPQVKAAGFRSVICNRPDDEGADQPDHEQLERVCVAHGLAFRYLPAEPGKVSDEQADEFGQLLRELPGPVLGFCRTGMRSTTMWALHMAANQSSVDILVAASSAGYDLRGVVRRIANGGKTPVDVVDDHHAVVIVGGGSAGIAAAASLLDRSPELDVAIIEPGDVHYYQPGWTMVGAGIFESATTARTVGSVIPRGARWIKAAVAAFEPDRNCVVLEGSRIIGYDQLVVCPGLKVDWHGVDGLADTIGRNGVTSNYRYDLAPYTWKLVNSFRGGPALFTQPPVPFKCAGAPQKAMYLSADHWRRSGVLSATQVHFHSAGGVLFGVPEYVPALMEYVQRYSIDLHFLDQLVAVDGKTKVATFKRGAQDGVTETIQREFEMIHVVPPQSAPDFIRVSPLADVAGWVDVDPGTLRHVNFDNVFALGDVGNMPNAKTAAAARKQAPVVAHNVLVNRGAKATDVNYDGYGSCPLTVERGKAVLAEFVYGGKLAPSFPNWLIDGTRASRAAWLLKERVLPPFYWGAMLKGREWLARPTTSTHP